MVITEIMVIMNKDENKSFLDKVCWFVCLDKFFIIKDVSKAFKKNVKHGMKLST